ncbi:transporter [Dokdonia pacifica]|uniref:Outer membrane protein TolC n=1 Tax=Dokdonia pacifica TaxID=1627892 RepID=A0A239AAU5_9FLAO|nr:TolC family protein [Dokdonia pacifica]GGG35661.1 transporter [Dokdonia pacifica]SNR92178.1 Outer membrane protein TolC [Dokdonia pacifica]
MTRILIILLLLTGFTIQAQDKKSFSLEEAIEFALDNNKTAINARRDIAKAIKQKWETTASGLPQIDGVIDYQNQLKQPTAFIPAEFFGGEPGTFAPVVFGTQQNASATATLTQLIFDGSYLVGLQAAKAFLDFSENSNEKTQLEIRKGVINAYGSVLITRENIIILNSNIATVKKNLDETRIIFENGLAEEEDVEQLQITYSQLLNQKVNAERLEGIAIQMLNLAIGVDIATDTQLTDTLTSLAKPGLGLFQDNPEIEKNVDYKIAYNLTEQRSLELKLERSKALPSLRGFINVGTAAGRDTFDFFDSDQRYFASSIFGLTLDVPLFSSGARSARTQRAKIALDQAETDFEYAQEQIRLAYEQAKSQHQLAIDNLEVFKNNLSLAERIEQKNQIKFKEGIASSFELRQAQTQLYSAQNSVLEAMLDMINSKAELETVLNTPDYRNTRN